MKAIEDMTIQEMVAEYTKATSPKLVLPDCMAIQMQHDERVDLLTRALDEKCLEAGVCLDMETKTRAIFLYNSFPPEADCFSPPIEAKDVHALLGYLLSKNT